MNEPAEITLSVIKTEIFDFDGSKLVLGSTTRKQGRSEVKEFFIEAVSTIEPPASASFERKMRRVLSASEIDECYQNIRNVVKSAHYQDNFGNPFQEAEVKALEGIVAGVRAGEAGKRSSFLRITFPNEGGPQGVSLFESAAQGVLTKFIDKLHVLSSF